MQGNPLTDNQLSADATYSASQSNQTLIDPGSGFKLYLKQLIVSASDAGAGQVKITDGNDASGKRIAVLNLANNGGAVIEFDGPGRRIEGVLKYTTGAGAAGDITALGYKVKVA